MSEYTKALAKLVALPGHLDEELAHSEREIDAERRRREEQIDSFAAEHEVILARLESILEQAHAEGIARAPGEADQKPARLGADPLEQAAQLVGRLDEVLRQTLYIRAALETEEAELSEAERKRAAEGRRRREREELQRGEAWERARQGTAGLGLALVVVAVVGAVVGAISSGAVALTALLVAVAGVGLGAAVNSTLPALAVQRATGAMAPSPSAPAREARLSTVAYVGTALTVAGLSALFATLASGNGPAAAAAVTLTGIVVTVFVYMVLPRAK